MNVVPSLSEPSSAKSFVYKNNKGLVIINTMWLLVSILNTFKALKHGFNFNFIDTFWPVLGIFYLLILIDQLLAKTTFTFNQNFLSVVRRNLFHKKTKIYEVDKMDDIEIEQITVNNIFRKKKVDQFIVTFFYDDKEVALGSGLNNFDAQAVYDAIVVRLNRD